MEDAAGANSSFPPPRIWAAPVRVVARICPGGGSRGSFQVAARISDSSSASVSFIPIVKEATPAATPSRTPCKDYVLDYCYLKEHPDSYIFNNEIKHLVTDVFCGDGPCNSSVVTCGATAKTHLIMGSQDHPGLIGMAVEQILKSAKTIGAAVSVSCYQVIEDHRVFDLLEPKDGEVLVLEDAKGTTHFKGLLRVNVKSIEEFTDLCCGGSYKLKHAAKLSNQSQAQGHHGFVIYISRFDQPGREYVVAKINFLNLAGCVDTNQKKYD